MEMMDHTRRGRDIGTEAARWKPRIVPSGRKARRGLQNRKKLRILLREDPKPPENEPRQANAHQERRHSLPNDEEEDEQEPEEPAIDAQKFQGPAKRLIALPALCTGKQMLRHDSKGYETDSANRRPKNPRSGMQKGKRIPSGPKRGSLGMERRQEDEHLGRADGG